MEKTMLIMIVIVAIVAIGGLLYINSDKSDIVPVFVESPSAPTTQVGPSVSTEPGQITFTVAKPSASAGGQIKFDVNVK